VYLLIQDKLINKQNNYSSNKRRTDSIITSKTEIILETSAPIAKDIAKSLYPKKNKNIAGTKCKSATKEVANILVAKNLDSPNLKIVANKFINNAINIVIALGKYRNIKLVVNDNIINISEIIFLAINY
jgi:hypothetical protein